MKKLSGTTYEQKYYQHNKAHPDTPHISSVRLCRVKKHLMLVT